MGPTVTTVLMMAQLLSIWGAFLSSPTSSLPTSAFWDIPKGSTATGVFGSASGNPHQDRVCVHESVCACVCVCLCCVCTCILVWFQGWVDVESC